MVYDFYLQNMIYVQWSDGSGRKNPEKYIYKKENKEKFPIWFPSHPPVWLVGLFLDWSPLLPYMADGTAHYAEKVGDTQHLWKAEFFL